ncbi:hypothetical protein QCD71_11030 [Sphingomonas sp. PsM26]|nr:hypothetical protein [Sphingomonas sp. PsM26]
MRALHSPCRRVGGPTKWARTLLPTLRHHFARKSRAPLRFSSYFHFVSAMFEKTIGYHRNLHYGRHWYLQGKFWTVRAPPD